MIDRAKEGPVGLGIVTKEWTRIGLTRFGGPPAHICDAASAEASGPKGRRRMVAR
jgi:hypothetical protein